MTRPMHPALTAILGAALLGMALSACSMESHAHLDLTWAETTDRPWPGPEIWANRVQDWTVRGGRLEAVIPRPMRTAHLLTRELDPASGAFEIVLELQFRGQAGRESGGGVITEAGNGAGGILLGIGSSLDPRRRALVHHSDGPGAGLFLGVTELGHLFVSDHGQGDLQEVRSEAALSSSGETELTIRVTPEGSGVRVSMTARPLGSSGDPVTLDMDLIPPERVAGGLSLVSHSPAPSDASASFRRLLIDGPGLAVLEGGALGPVLGAQHTLSRGTLRITAQLFPVSGPLDGSDTHVSDSVLLETVGEGGRWSRTQTAPVVVPGYTASFQVADWPLHRAVPYRLTYLPAQGQGGEGDSYEGLIRPEPESKEEIVVAAFTGNHNVASPGVDRGTFDWENHLWFPHEDIVSHVEAHDPDFLFFSGDQVYEGASPTAADFEHPYGDYLYKWYLWMWAFRDLTRDIPSVAVPDDHDVFHGNVWGAGGRSTPPGLSGAAAQDQGGYKLPAEWVNMVQRTHASHLPPPGDPDASAHEVDVYFTDILYGGVSFAVIEDRKFKSPPKLVLPEAEVWNGWAQNPAFHAPTQADVAGANLLGEAQERFLEEWAGEWTAGTWMKVVLSQTIFANVATIPSDAMSGSVIPSLPIPEPGVWVEGDKVAADMDSNGWPQSGRNRALRAMRKGFAVHIAGDQHLASTIQYGVEDWGDGPYALCVPSVANFWPRRWYPHQGDAVDPNQPTYTGNFQDGFGNRMTVRAVSNPSLWGREPGVLHNRAPGYGIARFNRETREVSLEAWPRWADPTVGDLPYPGWPIRFAQADGYGREAWGFLPTVEVQGMQDPVIQIVAEAGGEVLYTIRIQGQRFTPEVFGPGTYTIRLGEPGSSDWKVLLGQIATQDSTRVLGVAF